MKAVFVWLSEERPNHAFKRRPMRDGQRDIISLSQEYSVTNPPSHIAVKIELDRLAAEFFRAVSFEAGEVPSYQNIYALFIDPGLLIKNSGATPECYGLGR